jgi:hypothetical protein
MEYQVRSGEEIELFIRVEEDEKSGGVRYTLRRSHSKCWLEDVRGDEVLAAIDDGNGIKLTRKFKSLDYAEFSELLILLTFIKNFDGKISLNYVIEKAENLAQI